MSGVFNLGDPVLLVYSQRHKWIKHISDEKFHCNFGTYDLMELVGAPYGTKIVSSKEVFLIAYPSYLLQLSLEIVNFSILYSISFVEFHPT